jgi:methionine sulfoxide reductase heme-binding subunit
VNELLWYTGRGSGTMALILLTVVMVLGIVGRSGRPLPGLPRFTVADVHRNASLIALGLVMVHVIVLFLDPIAQLRLYDLIIPFDYVYRPFWAGLGVIGMELMVVVVTTSLVRRRIGPGIWRLVHWLSYAVWPIAWLHSWFTGTDADTIWFRLIAVASAAAVLFAVGWRLTPRFPELERPNAAKALPARTRSGAP